jgi:hypothetical protein
MDTLFPTKYNAIRDLIVELGYIGKCKAQDATRVKVWGGYTKQLDKFYNLYTNVQADQSLHENINSGRSGECILVFGGLHITYPCFDPYGCVACHVPHTKRFTLKGLCEEATA